MSRKRIAALVGNPNAGKSALFNALTGARSPWNSPVTTSRVTASSGLAASKL